MFWLLQHEYKTLTSHNSSTGKVALEYSDHELEEFNLCAVFMKAQIYSEKVVY